MESDEDNFSLSGLAQNTFLPNHIILDDELSIIVSILESENRDFVVLQRIVRGKNGRTKEIIKHQ